ncbi:hypothetical protein CRG98_023047 [Punica granatum]|uniref:Uncharacterized protein n=1 Tax=Punica granatum TaxID=22663 RepID=A0A2I0JJR7_PUNGR|nr:hypothetical protein CRG98_023047 [Punica granatum]
MPRIIMKYISYYRIDDRLPLGHTPIPNNHDSESDLHVSDYTFRSYPTLFFNTVWETEEREIPQDIKNHIESLGGKDILFACERPLTNANVNKVLHRLVMPKSIIRWSPSFPHDDEKELLKTREMNDIWFRCSTPDSRFAIWD